MRMDTDKAGRLRLAEQMELLSLPPRQRAKALRKMGAELIKLARRNVKQQQTTSGRPMSPRKNKRVRRRMLSKLPGFLGVYRLDPYSMAVTYRNEIGLVAHKHQYGSEDVFTAQQKEKQTAKKDKNDQPATRAIAKSLRDAGYRRPVKRERGKGRRFKRASLKWIQENMTVGQAGLIYHILQGNPSTRPQRWTVKTPARPFLGPKPGDESRLLNDLARQALSDIRNR
jgi:phage gpG-like protein